MLRKLYKDFNTRLTNELKFFKRKKECSKIKVKARFYDWAYSNLGKVEKNEEIASLRMGELNESLDLSVELELKEKDIKDLKVFTDAGYRLILYVDKIL